MKFVNYSVIALSAVMIAIWVGFRRPAEIYVAEPVVTDGGLALVSNLRADSVPQTQPVEVPKAKTPEGLARIQLRSELAAAELKLSEAQKALNEFLTVYPKPEMPVCENRFWQDQSLKFSMNGSVSAITKSTVTLLKSEGPSVTVPRNKLCRSDILYLDSTFDKYVDAFETWAKQKLALDGELTAALKTSESIALRLKDEIERQEAIAAAEAAKANPPAAKEPAPVYASNNPLPYSTFSPSGLGGSTSHSSDYSSLSSYRSSARGTIHVGPRGGEYYINRNGNKTYLSSNRKSSKGSSGGSRSSRRRR